MSELKVYTLDEVAAILKLHRRTVTTYIRDGKLKAVKIGKYWKITEENLKAFLETGGN